MSDAPYIHVTIESDEIVIIVPSAIDAQARNAAFLTDLMHNTHVNTVAGTREYRLASNEIAQRFLEGLAHQCRATGNFPCIHDIIESLRQLRDSNEGTP